MREFFREYLHIITTSLTALLFGIGFFYLLLNAFHASSMNKSLFVNIIDPDYVDFMTNVETMTNNTNNYRYEPKKYAYDVGLMESIVAKLRICQTMLTAEESLYSVSTLPNIKFKDVYEYNNYFINTLNDKCYVSNIAWIIYDEEEYNTRYYTKVKLYDRYVASLVDNAKFLRNELRDNSSYYFNTGVSNSMIRNNLGSVYQKVVRNYADFSYIVADLTNYLAEGENGKNFK